ncbi:MAG: hypothetical protein H0W20_02785 [Chthoniobacterales bacterium]|nr:hypothetical protein [Chthoniobacterales bacterium]
MKDAKGNRGSTAEASRHVDKHVPPPRPVIGLEAEFTLFVDDVKRRPEDVFGTPAKLINQPMIPRTGRSFQLPSGGAIYFDTGVIEVATPIVEVQPGCCYRATRLLWEQIRYVRQELDEWGVRNDCRCRLQGFSTHYNLSFPDERRSTVRTAAKLGRLLAQIAPMPVALLAANRESSAVGVRPRGSRVEVTADFTPDAALMLATCAFIAGAFEGILHWENYRAEQLPRHSIPQPVPLRLRKHSSRRGWRVVRSSLQHDPFQTDPNKPIWKVRDGRVLSMRQIAAETMKPFRKQIRQLSDGATLEHIEAVFAGDARSLLDFPDRPSAYEDAGHGIDWNRRRVRHWARSDYEKVIHRVIAREPIRISGKHYVVQRMQGWYEIVFREVKTRRQRVFNLDELVRLTRKR